MYGIYSKFDAEMHKKTFVNYLEVVIEEDGTVSYAVPSHQQHIADIACKKLGISHAELEQLCPPKYYGDYLIWLCKCSHAIAVWNDFYIAPYCNGKQLAVLKKLKLMGVYKGILPVKTN